MKNSALSALGTRTGEPPISWLMELTLTRPHLISLAAGFTDDPSLPVEDSRALLAEVLGDPRRAAKALQYGSTAGDPELRQRTAERLSALDRAARGADGSFPASAHAAERVLITNGSQQLLYMLSEALCDPGDIVLVEDPTYFVFLGIVESHGLACRGIRMQPDGIDLEHLEQVLDALKRARQLRRVKMLYLVTYHQNPTGRTTALEKKAKALALLRRYEKAAGHPIYLVEDAAYREMRFAGPDTPSALVLPGAEERVVYTSTYTKPFATGVRVGFGLLPAALHEVVLHIKGNHDFGSASLLQALLARALAGGAYGRQQEVLRARYAAKAAVMGAALKESFPPDVRWDTPRGGLYFWAELPRRMPTGPRSRIFQTALDQGVLYVPGALCYAPDPTRAKPNAQMRLSFGNASEDSIREGIRRLGASLTAAQAEAPRRLRRRSA